jgi:hypothetical protein
MRIVSYAGVRKSEVVQTAHEPVISLGGCEGVARRGAARVRRWFQLVGRSVSWSTGAGRGFCC